jgi:CHAD domain-containing protein
MPDFQSTKPIVVVNRSGLKWTFMIYSHLCVCEPYSLILARRIDKLLRRVRVEGEHRAGAPAGQAFRSWTREQLRTMVDQFFAAIPGDAWEVATLHQLRIRGKSLRYGMELVAAAFPETFRTELYAVVEAMQDRLGTIDDLATAVARLEQKARNSSDELSWRRLLANKQWRLAQSRREYRAARLRGCKR